MARPVAAQRPHAGPDAGRHQVIRHLGTTDLSAPRVRIVDAMLGCLARQGIHKTTVDEVAKEAGISRATLYRLFPGGKDAVLAAVVETEVARLFSALAVAMGEAQELDEVLVVGMVETARRLRDHRALAYLVEHEPGKVLPYLSFSGLDRLLLAAASFAAPFFARWLEPDQARRAAEWATRIVFSYVANPTERIDLTDPEDTRHLVTTFVVPGIQALRSSAEATGARRPAPGRPAKTGAAGTSAPGKDQEGPPAARGRTTTGRPATARQRPAAGAQPSSKQRRTTIATTKGTGKINKEATR
jgi:AcrR family transcriptional regulator